MHERRGRPRPHHRTAFTFLRAQAAEDFDAYAAFYGSERSRGMGGPLDRPAPRAFATELGHVQLRGYGFWMADVTATGETVGRGPVNP
ncbi:MAG: hypothetical protein R3D80_20025 [Paracoccaceae bacterium]